MLEHCASEQLIIELPAQPAALSRLNLLLDQATLDWRETSELIEGDMALAAALLKTVNSSQFNLKARVQTVQQALSYLGTRQVASVTYAIGLRAAFPQARLLQPLWLRAGRRGALMANLALALGQAPWAAHSAGLFQECGKAVLFRYAPDRYAPLLIATEGDDFELAQLEKSLFGVSHDWLGGALCETWGLAPAAMHVVRHRLTVHATLTLPVPAPERAVCAVDLLAHAVMAAPETLDDLCLALAPQLGLDPEWLLQAVRDVAAAEAASAVPLFR
jgi:HD-like signal output (HDOD) protein